MVGVTGGFRTTSIDTKKYTDLHILLTKSIGYVFGLINPGADPEGDLIELQYASTLYGVGSEEDVYRIAPILRTMANATGDNEPATPFFITAEELVHEPVTYFSREDIGFQQKLPLDKRHNIVKLFLSTYDISSEVLGAPDAESVAAEINSIEGLDKDKLLEVLQKDTESDIPETQDIPEMPEMPKMPELPLDVGAPPGVGAPKRK